MSLGLAKMTNVAGKKEGNQVFISSFLKVPLLFLHVSCAPSHSAPLAQGKGSLCLWLVLRVLSFRTCCVVLSHLGLFAGLHPELLSCCRSAFGNQQRYLFCSGKVATECILTHPPPPHVLCEGQWRWRISPSPWAATDGSLGAGVEERPPLQPPAPVQTCQWRWGALGVIFKQWDVLVCLFADYLSWAQRVAAKTREQLMVPLATAGRLSPRGSESLVRYHTSSHHSSRMIREVLTVAWP